MAEITNFTIGLCQIRSVSGDVEANLRLIEQCCKVAVSGEQELYAEGQATRKPDLLVFPELATIGYYAGATAHRELAETSADKIARCLCKLAKKYQVGLLVGTAERDSADPEKVYDSALCIDSYGNVVGSYRKPHLFIETEFHFTQGLSLQPIRLNELNLGVMICADIRSPETARALTIQGAQILIGLTHWRHDNRHERDSLLRARAIENFIPLVDVNAMGEGKEDAEPYGNSIALDERGRCLLCLKSEKSIREYQVGLVTLELYPPGERSLYGTKHFQRREKLYAPLLVL